MGRGTISAPTRARRSNASRISMSRPSAPRTSRGTTPGTCGRSHSRPAARRRVIVNTPGGREGQSRRGFIGGNNYYVNELGMAIVYPNIRGSGGYGKTFVTLDNGVRREDAYKDIGALLDWIRTRPDLDAERVLVTGGSYGGHMTLVTATRDDERIFCSVDVVGVSKPPTFLQNTSRYRPDLRRLADGDERHPTTRAPAEPR